MSQPVGTRLEEYTRKRPQEVLLVSIEVAGTPDQIVIFKGFSSSLMYATAFDPDVPVLPDTAEIISIDRLRGPYNPRSPEYIQPGLTWEEMVSLLLQVGV